MTRHERMAAGLLYDPGDREITAEQVPYQDKLWGFNQLRPSDVEKKQQSMKEVFAECGEGCYIELPFHANRGGRHVHLGCGIYINSNATFVDDGHIHVADKVMLGPIVTIVTASHPVDPVLRSRGLQYNRDVHIGENAWIGAGGNSRPHTDEPGTRYTGVISFLRDPDSIKASICYTAVLMKGSRMEKGEWSCPICA